VFFTARARKKKCLTDPVDLIPFPAQNLRDAVSSASKPLAPSVRKIYEKPAVEQKILSVPSGELNTSTLSIKKMMEIKDDERTGISTLPENLPFNTYSYDQVKMLWRRFAFEMKEKGMETFYNAMIKREPVQKEDHLILMDVDNQIQIDYIKPHLQDMIGFFRKELKNYAIEIDFSLNDNPEKEVKFLTGKDRFASLARKNPNLHTLKNTFNLDIEY
jgi:hypothetical protein